MLVSLLIQKILYCTGAARRVADFYMEVDMPSRCLCTSLALALIFAFGLIGCSGGGGGPIMPDVAGTDPEITPSTSPRTQAGDSGASQGLKARHTWGVWLMHVNADHSIIEPEPLRNANFHLNITGYLEWPPGFPGQNLLRIVNASFSEFDTLLVDIRLIHPFTSQPGLTGRDVRGIAILPAEKIFPATTVIDAEGDETPIYASRRLLNADGYTTLWNRWMSEEIYYPQIFGYIRGELATKDEYYIQGNLHGYKNFWTDRREHVFQSGQSATRTYEFDFPPGPLTFAYAVDVSWSPPLNKPVTDIWEDFGTSASCPEPYQISTNVVSNSLTRTSGSATVQFDVSDWQDRNNFSHVHVEAPDLFYGTIDPGPPVGFPNDRTARYEVVVPNTKGNAITTGGGSDLLIAVEDMENSTVNPDLTAYQIVKIPVADVPGFWRDRNGDGSFVNKQLALPLIQPSSLSTGKPDLAVVSYPEPPCDFFGGQPELMLFDDDDERFIVYNRNLNSSVEKAGYPFVIPPSWLLYPHCMDATTDGYFGVGSTNEAVVSGNYRVKHLMNVFDPCGIYGFSWHTGTDDGSPNAFRETLRDVTSGFDNVLGNPLFGFFAYESGTIPTDTHALSVGDPYIDPQHSNTWRTSIPMVNAGGVPFAVDYNAERLRVGIDTQPIGLDSLHGAFYIVESNPVAGTSEVEGFDINFMNLPTDPIWNLDDSDIKSEFPGAYALDCEVVPSHYNLIVTVGDNIAEYNWLCVLMRDNTDYWLAFYDPLNPSPDNPGNDVRRTIYTSNKITIPNVGFEPVAMDVDHQHFEVYVLCRDAADDYFVSVFEFFY